MCKNLLASIQCALTHDIRVCDECRLCKGKNAAEIRVNLLAELRAALTGDEAPVADENGLIKINEGHYRLVVDDEEEDEDEGSSEINR